MVDSAALNHVCWFDQPSKLAQFVTWLASEGYDAAEIAAATEKPWHWNDEAKEAGVA